MNFETSQDFIDQCPEISARQAYKLIRSHGASLIEFLSENEANAQLIASAPELLEACKAVLLWAKSSVNHGGNPYCMDFVKASQNAIAKAEGKV